MKNNPNHGNRLRPSADSYEVKKQRARDRYADAQLKVNAFWLHNKILRDLVNLYGLNNEIPLEAFTNRGFDVKVFKFEAQSNGYKVLCYDTYGFYLLNNKKGCICKLSN